MVNSVKKIYKDNEFLKKIIIVIIGGISSGIGLKIFLIPANVFSAGANGIAQIISGVTFNLLGIQIDTGILIFLLNIPISILGWVYLGKKSTIYSFFTIISVSLFTLLIPVHQITDNQMMNGIAGGVFVGITSGLTMKYGFSGGGMDIVSLVLSKKTGKSVGTLLFFINLLIILSAGFLFDWESALFTIISIFCMTQVVDAIHTSHQKVTVLVMTDHPEKVTQSLQDNLARGMTLIPGMGVYRKQEVSIIMIVITRYELYNLENIVYDVDRSAFVNIIPTKTVWGNFWDEEAQKRINDAKI